MPRFINLLLYSTFVLLWKLKRNSKRSLIKSLDHPQTDIPVLIQQSKLVDLKNFLLILFHDWEPKIKRNSKIFRSWEDFQDNQMANELISWWTVDTWCYIFNTLTILLFLLKRKMENFKEIVLKNIFFHSPVWRKKYLQKKNFWIFLFRERIGKKIQISFSKTLNPLIFFWHCTYFLTLNSKNYLWKKHYYLSFLIKKKILSRGVLCVFWREKKKRRKFELSQIFFCPQNFQEIQEKKFLSSFLKLIWTPQTPKFKKKMQEFFFWMTFWNLHFFRFGWVGQSPNFSKGLSNPKL